MVMPVSAKRAYTDEPVRVACRDLATDLSGQLIVQDDELLLILTSFEQQWIYNHEETRIERIETGEYATLLDCIDGGLARKGGTSDFCCYQQNVIPNMVVIGSRAWTSTDLIRSASFAFVGAETALHYGEHRRFDVSSDRDTYEIDYNRLNILSVQGGGVHVRLWVSVTFGFSIDVETHSTPIVILNLDDGVPIHSFMPIVHQILIFFEISLGVRSRAREIKITPLTEQERETLSDPTYEEFRMRLWFADWAPLERATHLGDVAFPVHRSSDRDATASALSAWLERREAWKISYALAKAYLRTIDTYGRDRLLRLFAWFEAIPLYQERSGILRPQIAKLATAAYREAQEQSIEIDKNRLREVLSELKHRPLKERMALAVGRVRARFGCGVVPPEIDTDCREAVRLRNLAAHGRLTTDDFDFPSFVRAIDAAQMVCFLSMLVDLDLCEASAPFQTRSLHPLMSYRLHKTKHAI
jgi:hypothetical protein